MLQVHTVHLTGSTGASGKTEDGARAQEILLSATGKAQFQACNASEGQSWKSFGRDGLGGGRALPNYSIEQFLGQGYGSVMHTTPSYCVKVDVVSLHQTR